MEGYSQQAGNSARGLAGIGTANQPIEKSSSPVRDRIGALEEICSQLHASIESLEQRFDTILTPAPPQPATDARNAVPQRLQSHVQGRLEILMEGYQAAIGRLHQLSQRVEL